MITGIILASLLFVGIVFLPAGHLSLVLAAIIFLGGWEWARLATLKPVESIIFYLAIGFSMFALLQWPAELRVEQWLLWVSFIWWTWAAMMILRYEPKQVDHSRGMVRLSKALMGLLTLVPAWWALVQLRGFGAKGVEYLFYSFIIVWGADIGAYFVGKKLGKHKLAPRISPGKTIEGMLGGLLAVGAASVFAAWYFGHTHTRLLIFILLSLIVAVYSVLGDLLESLLKRQVGLKDSGKLLPGHGGVLDRIDSVLAAAPLLLFGLIAFLDN